jgi:hypothetical protein
VGIDGWWERYLPLGGGFGGIFFGKENVIKWSFGIYIMRNGN